MEPGRLLTSAALIALVLVPLLAAATNSPAGEALAHQAGRATYCLLLAGAGVLVAVRWRVTGEALDAHLSGVLLLVGALVPPLAAAGPLVHSRPELETASPLTRSVVLAIAGYGVVQALRAPAVDAALRPLRRFALRVIVTVLAVWLLSRLLRSTGTVDEPHLWMVAEAALASMLLALGVVQLRRSGTDARSEHLWFGTLLLLLAISTAFRVIGYAGWDSWVVVGAACSLVGACVALVGSATDLHRTLDRQRSDLRQLSDALGEAEEELRHAAHRHQERLHDIRSALAALRSANQVLLTDGVLSPHVRWSLTQALASELSRLQQLADPRLVDEVCLLDLHEVVAPIVGTERAHGTTVHLDVEGGVLARRTDLASVVQNLLVNARSYAPGPVRVHTECTPGEIALHVDDEGPGIPDAELPLVVCRGVRGDGAASGTGSGLGLFVCSRLLDDLGGRLELRNRPGGGLRASVVLPAVTVRAPLPAQRRMTRSLR